jgi:hypothetical protein
MACPAPVFHRKKGGLVLTQISLALFLAVVSPAMLAADGAETTEVKDVIQQFHHALDRHDVAAIETLVSADVVVLGPSESGACVEGGSVGLECEATE